MVYQLVCYYAIYTSQQLKFDYITQQHTCKCQSHTKWRSICVTGHRMQQSSHQYIRMEMFPTETDTNEATQNISPNFRWSIPKTISSLKK